MAKKVIENRTKAKKKSDDKKIIKKIINPIPTTLVKKTKATEKANSKKNKDTAKKQIPKAKPTTTIVKAKKTVKDNPAVVVVKKNSVLKKAQKAAAKISLVKKPIDIIVKNITKSDKKIVIDVKPLPTIVIPSKLLPVKSILISQPKPDLGKSPYIDLAQQFKIKLDWRPFTKVEGILAADFRKQKIYIEQYSCVIFSSRIAIEQYFRICDELRLKINEDNKYFCYSEAIALYLQKFIQYRKRKVFFGDGRLPKLMEIILKHKEDGKFLLPCSDVRDRALADTLIKHNIPYSEAFIYKTVASDLSDLSDVKYDMLVFFNPSAIESLFANFPKFKQEETRLAIFGNSTADAVTARKLNINVFAPTPENPSLVDPIKRYITEANKKGNK